jgi:hypothetical protein
MAMRHGDRAAANRAAELIGRHLNMFVDRKEIQINADEYLARIMEQIGAKVIEHELAPAQLDAGPRREAAVQGSERAAPAAHKRHR